MGLKAFIALYMLLLLAGVPVTLLSCIPYGLFGILAAACMFGLLTCRDTAPQNVCMGMIGFVLAIVTEAFVSELLHMLIPPAFSDPQYMRYISFGVNLVHIVLFYLITLFCGRLLKKILLSGKGLLRFQQTWYLIDAVLLPTKNLIDQGDYKLNQLGNIGVLEIKSLLSAKMIYAHESGIDVTIDIPDRVDRFMIDTVDLARILGIFLDNAVEAALETEQPQMGLNIIQDQAGVSIIISNCFQDHGLMLNRLKQKGVSTKPGHQGIGLSNVQKILSSYDNVLLETSIQRGRFMQHMVLVY